MSTSGLPWGFRYRTRTISDNTSWANAGKGYRVFADGDTQKPAGLSAINGKEEEVWMTPIYQHFVHQKPYIARLVLARRTLSISFTGYQHFIH
jgi:hypothetical protein